MPKEWYAWGYESHLDSLSIEYDGAWEGEWSGNRWDRDVALCWFAAGWQDNGRRDGAGWWCYGKGVLSGKTLFFTENACIIGTEALPLQSLLHETGKSILPGMKLPNGVMVALQILVLSVWVRVLVRQQ